MNLEIEPIKKIKQEGMKVVDARYSWHTMWEVVRAVKNAKVNGVVEILTTDPGADKDIPEWIEHTNHELLEIKDYGDYKGFIIKKTH